MTLEQAYKLLRFDDDEMRLGEMERILGKNYSINQNQFVMSEACRIACDCIKRCMEMEDDGR